MAVTRTKFISNYEVNRFKTIMAGLDRNLSDPKILALIEEARNILKKHDIGWDSISIRCPADYVPISKRHKANKRPASTRTPQSLAKAAQALNGTGTGGLDGRALLKFAIARHPEWSTVRDTLSLNLLNADNQELVAIAQILKIDEAFVKMAVEAREPSMKEAAGVEETTNPNE